MTNNPKIRIARKKRNHLLGKVFAGVVIGGSVLGTATILLSGPYKNEYRAEPLPVRAEPAPKVEAPVVEMEPEVVDLEKVEEKAPALAIPHEDAETDFVAQAGRELADGDLKAAFSSLRKSLHETEPTIDVLLRIGRVGREIGELSLAEQALREAERIDQTDAVVKVELARVYMKMKRPKEAHEVATSAIELDRDNPSGWNLVGRAAMALSEWQRAEAAFSQAVEIDPLNAMYRNNLGLLFIHLKRADAAIDELETAVELFEDEAPHFTFNNLGLAHELGGNYEEAREAFEEALVISPFYATATVNLRRVETTIANLEEKRAFETAKTVEPVPPAELELGDLQMPEDI